MSRVSYGDCGKNCPSSNKLSPICLQMDSGVNLASSYENWKIWIALTSQNRLLSIVTR